MAQCGGLGEHGVFGCGPGLELWEEVRVAAVAHGDGDVAVQALAAGALDRASPRTIA